MLAGSRWLGPYRRFLALTGAAARVPGGPNVGAVQQLSPTVQWIGPGTTVKVGGHQIPGGLLYVGRGLRAATGGGVEPALIDGSLPVRGRNPDHDGSTMGYWPSYADIKPQARAAYLSWLAGGRRDPDAYIGYVFLFFYGLERRALVDLPRDPSLTWEVPYLRAEVQRLLDLYRTNNSFRGYATGLLDVLDLQGTQGASGQASPPTLLAEHRYQPPTSLIVEIGSFASNNNPVPAEWALAWAWYHPEIHLRTPATRCTEEFAALFKSRYTAAHKDGIVVQTGKKRVGLVLRR